jgi:hypothetical protein
VLIAVLFNEILPGWRSQFKGTFLMSSGGDIIKEFQQAILLAVSRLFKNVPILDSLEMSPF